MFSTTTNILGGVSDQLENWLFGESSTSLMNHTQRGQKSTPIQSLNPGDHLIWESVKEDSYLWTRVERIFRKSSRNRLSCLLDVNFAYEGKEYFCFLFDMVINDRPNLAEITFSTLLPIQIPNLINHIVLVPVLSWEYSEIILTKTKEVSDRSLVKCKIPDCLHVGERCQFIGLCEIHNTHFCCLSHFIPIGSDLVAWSDEMRDKLRTEASFTDQSQLETALRYLYLMHTFNTSLSMSQLKKTVSESSVYICPFCFQEDEIYTATPLINLQQQFQNPIGYQMVENGDERSESRSQSNSRRNSTPGTSDSDDGKYDRSDPYARKVTKNVKKATIVRGDSNEVDNRITRGTGPVNLQLDETGLPFKMTTKWKSLPYLTQRRLTDWESYFEQLGFATRNEMEQIFREQSAEVLNELTMQDLKVFISSFRDKGNNTKSDLFASGYMSQGIATAVAVASPRTNPLSTRSPSTTRRQRIQEMSGASSSSKLRRIELRVCQPERPEMMRSIRIFPDLTYDDVLRLSCEVLGISVLWRSMVLIKRNADGWNEKIEYDQGRNRSRDPSPAVGVSSGSSIVTTGVWDQFQDQDILEVRRMAGAYLGGRFTLQTIAQLDRNNPSVQQKILDLSQQYVGYREIRGDGNCYYRSVFCGIIEYLISTPDIKQREQGFQYLFDKFRAIGYRDPLPEGHVNLLRILQAAAANRKWMTIMEYEADILREENGLDEIAIFNCKKLITDYILTHRDQEFNGITIANAVLFTNERYQSLTQYCKEEIMKMEVCAEGVHVDLGILPCLLGSRCEVIYLDRAENNLLTIRETNGLPMSKIIAEVSLLFRPGHYDLLYKKLKESPDHQRNSDIPSQPVVDISKGVLVKNGNTEIPTKERKLATPPVALQNNPPAIDPPDSLAPPSTITSTETTQQTDLSSPMVISPVESSTVSRKETVGNHTNSSPVTTPAPPKLSSEDLDRLIDTLAEEDFRLRAHQREFKKMMEMGFSLEVVLEAWANHRYHIVLESEWLEKCIETSEKMEKDQKQREASTQKDKEEKHKAVNVTQTRGNSNNSLTLLETAFPESKETKKSSPDHVENVQTFPSKLALTNSPSSGDKPEITRKAIAPAISIPSQAIPPLTTKSSLESKHSPKPSEPLPKDEDVIWTEEEKEMVRKIRDESVLGKNTWNHIERMSKEIQRKYHYPFSDILETILRNPYNRNTTTVVEKLQQQGSSSRAQKKSDVTHTQEYDENDPYPFATSPPLSTPSKFNSSPSRFSKPLDTTSVSSPTISPLSQVQAGAIGANTASTASPSRVSMLVSQFNRRSVPNSPERPSQSSSPISGMVKRPALIASPKTTPKTLGVSPVTAPSTKSALAADAPNDINGYFELYQAKQQYPRIAWNHAEKEAKALFASYQVPMQYIIEAIVKHGALFSESIKNIIESKFNYKLYLRSTPLDPPLQGVTPSSLVYPPPAPIVKRETVGLPPKAPELPSILPATSLSSQGKEIELYEEKASWKSSESISLDPRKSLSRFQRECLEYSADEPVNQVISKSQEMFKELQSNSRDPDHISLTYSSHSSLIDDDNRSTSVYTATGTLKLPKEIIKSDLPPSTSSSAFLSKANYLSLPVSSTALTRDNPSQSKSISVPPEYQLNYVYTNPANQALYDYLVYDLLLPPDIIKQTIEDFGCQNLRSALIAAKTLMKHERPFFKDLAPRDANPVIDRQMKDVILKTVKEFGYAIDEILNAIAFDRCIHVEDVIDVMESKQLLEAERKRKTEKDSSNTSTGELSIHQILELIDHNALTSSEFHSPFSSSSPIMKSRKIDRTANDHFQSRYLTSDVSRRSMNYSNALSPSSPSRKSNLSTSHVSSPQKVSKESKTNSSPRKTIDHGKIAREIKALNRESVLQQLKKLGLYQEKISGDSTRALRELLLKHLQEMLKVK